jgi:hypothetical protein
MSELHTPIKASRSNQNFLEDSINGRMSSAAFKQSVINGKVSQEMLEFDPREERLPPLSTGLIQPIQSNILNPGQLFDMEVMLDDLIGKLERIHAEMTQVKQEN